MDDDNYVNPRALLQLLKTFPQDRDVYVGKPSLNRPIHASELQSKNRTVCSSFSSWLLLSRGGLILGAGPMQEAGPECLIRLGSSRRRGLARRPVSGLLGFFDSIRDQIPRDLVSPWICTGS